MTSPLDQLPATPQVCVGAIVVEELREAFDELTVGELVQRDPCRLRGVVAGDGRGFRLEQGHREVEDHEVVTVADALDPAHELAAHALETGLLGQLANHGFGQQLTGLEGVCGELVGWVERVGDGHHFVILDFAVTLLEPEAEPVAGDDAAEAAWVALHDLADHQLVEGLAEFLHDHGIIETIL